MHPGCSPPKPNHCLFRNQKKKKRPTTTENHRIESKTRIECTGQEHTVDDGTLRHVRTWCDSIRKSSTSKMSMVCCCVPSTGGGATNSVLRYFFFLSTSNQFAVGYILATTNVRRCKTEWRNWNSARCVSWRKCVRNRLRPIGGRRTSARSQACVFSFLVSICLHACCCDACCVASRDLPAQRHQITKFIFSYRIESWSAHTACNARICSICIRIEGNWLFPKEFPCTPKCSTPHFAHTLWWRKNDIYRWV